MIKEVAAAFERAIDTVDIGKVSREEAFFIKRGGQYGMIYDTSGYIVNDHRQSILHLYESGRVDKRYRRSEHVAEDMMEDTGIIRAAVDMRRYPVGTFTVEIHSIPTVPQLRAIRDFIIHNNVTPERFIADIRVEGYTERLFRRAVGMI